MDQQERNYSSEKGRKLKKRAKKILSGRDNLDNEADTLDVKRLLTELQIHQIELEVQNDELRRTQIQLIAEREKYSDLYNFAPTAYFTFNEKGVIVELNLSAADLLGHSRKYLNNHPITPYIASNSLPIFLHHIKQVLSTKKFKTCELTLRPHDQEEVIIHVDSMAVQDEDNELLVRSVMSDITAQKRIEQRLYQSEEKFRRFFEQSSDGVALLDEKGYVIEWNGALEEITNLSKAQVFGKPFIEIQAILTLPEYRSPELLAQALQTGDAPFMTGMIEAPYQRPDGEIRYVQQTVFPIKTSQGYQIGLHSQDITKKKLADEKLRESEERFRTLVHSMDDIIYTLDSDQKHTGVYGDWVERSGQTAEFYLGKSARDIFGPEAAKIHEEANTKALGGTTVVYEWSVEVPDGTLHYQTAVSPLRDADSDITGIVGIGRNITNQKQNEEAIKRVNEDLKAYIDEIEELQGQLREQAIRDPLTGLFNRRYLQETLKREIARADREKISLSLMIMDVDYFKRINDSYGHSGGDEMLRSIGRLIEENIRLGDFPCRYGGEEFVIMMPGATLQDVQKRANSIREKIAALRVKYGKHELRVTISSGVATYPLHGTNGDEVLVRADRALYQAKQDGRNRVSVYQDSLHTPHPWE